MVESHAGVLPVPPAELADIPMPAYIYDIAEVRRNHGLLRAALPDRTGLFYSLKANPHPALLTTLRAAGTRPEVCSTGELDAALGAGWDPADALYTGPGKSDAEIRDALARGVRLFSVDSPYAIEQLDRLAAECEVTARCLLRINDDQPVPGQGLVMAGVASQFGADTGWVMAEPERFRDRPRAEVVGLHLYMGTNLTDVDSLYGQFQRSLATARQLTELLAEHGVRLRVLDLGGGFGAPFAKAGGAVDLAALRPRLEELFDEEIPGWRGGAPEVVFESGRYLVGTAGTLVTPVLDVKRSQGKDVVVLASGIHHLGGMSGLRRLPVLAPHVVRAAAGPAPAPKPDATELDALVVGPLCTPLDTWARSAKLPALSPGDLVAVPNVGAYGLYASLVAFLGHPLPAEAVVDSDRPGTAPVTTRVSLTRTPVSSAPDPTSGVN
ncbi:diaminopimelate decarboxylase [Streptomyces sp. 3213]|uniref:decarboxylase n=1 Tax=Streptomyces sp. 3213.3 TaxID=1855348 RepID=UPI0008942BB1|nr:decarboxylase [Streptomyces sp. 3213.3]SEC38428.1 diaminopimelate decarboxylase [Streptomyces sp. 3213] [Streptomyces sp. 3213.3]